MFRGRIGILWRRVHEIEFTLPRHCLLRCITGPYGCYCVCDPPIEGCVRVRVDIVFLDICHVFSDLRGIRLVLELLNGSYQCFHAVDQVLVYGQPVQGSFFLCVAILVYNLHLLHDG